jgi:hypothetical protein
MNLQKQPNSIDFLGDKPEFVIRATPYSTTGRTARHAVRIYSLEVGTLSLQSPHAPVASDYCWRWSVESSPAESDNIGKLTAIPSGTTNGGELIKQQIESKVKYHPEVRDFYNVNCSVDGNGYCVVDIESWEPEDCDEGSIESQKYLFVHQGASSVEYLLWSSLGNQNIPTILPKPRTAKPDYRVSYLFEYRHRFSYLEKTGYTPEMFTEHSDNKITVGCAILESLFGAPDLPMPLSDCDFLYKACMQVRLAYAEYYTNENGSGKKTQRLSEWFQLFNGSTDKYNALYNLPNDGNNSSYTNTSHAMLFSQQNGELVFFDNPSTEQYLYVGNFTGSTAVVKLVIIEGVSSFQVLANTFNLNNGSVYRIGASLEALGVPNAASVLSYTLKLIDATDSSNNIVIGERIFEKKRYSYGSHTFLLLNAMNLYESMMVDFLEQEVTMEGERQVYVSEDRYATTDEQIIYKATTGYRTAKELQLLQSSFAKQYNLFVEDDNRQYVWYIDMVPGSVKVLDEKEDLINCEFQFRKRSRHYRRLARVGLNIVSSLPNLSEAVFE